MWILESSDSMKKVNKEIFVNFEFLLKFLIYDRLDFWFCGKGIRGKGDGV